MYASIHKRVFYAKGVGASRSNKLSSAINISRVFAPRLYAKPQKSRARAQLYTLARGSFMNRVGDVCAQRFVAGSPIAYLSMHLYDALRKPRRG